MEQQRPRKFWEYIEPDGTRSNVRVTYLIVCVLVTTAICTVAALLGGIEIWWPMIPGGALLGAIGATLVHAIDYVHDINEARHG